MPGEDLCRTCLLAEGDTHWIGCEKCNSWFHGCCVGLSPDQIDSIADFYCESCSDRDPSLSTRRKAPDFSQLRKPALQTELAARDLPIQGNKALLLQRLTDFEQARAHSFDLPFFTHGRSQILKRIPKACRHGAATKLAQLVESVVRKPLSLLAWRRLFAFAPVCLRNRNPDEKAKNVSLTAFVNRQIREFDRSWHAPVPVPKTKKKPGTNGPRGPSIADRVSAKISDGDVKGAVRIAASDDSIAPFTQETFDLLREKHPIQNPNTVLPTAPTVDDPPVAPLVVDISDVRNVIQSFPAGSAGGPDGIRPQHLKDLTAKSVGEPGDRLLSALVDFSNLCLRGSIPSAVCPSFFGASLCALTKPGGGVRPIAVGNTLRRIVRKIAGKVATRSLSDYFNPVQFGCGTPKGAEGVARAAFDFVASVSEEKVLLKIDFRNAFNTIRRDVVLKSAREHIPDLYPFAWQAYSAPSHLYFMNGHILSQEGVQQGDPKGPILFSLGIHALIRDLTSEFNAWYLDDGTVGGDVDTVLTDFQKIIDASASNGLEINASKCELIVLNADPDREVQILESFKQVAPDIRAVDLANATLLGTAISEDAVEGVLKLKLEEFKRLSERLRDLDAHEAYYLLKHCFALPKLLYVLRSCPAFDCPILAEYDSLLRSTLESILNVSYTDRDWCKASLPVANGGLGIRKASALSVPAYLASSFGCERIVASILPENFPGNRERVQQRALEHWYGLAGTNDEPAVRTRQKDWDVAICEARLFMLKTTATDQQELARLHAVSSPHAGDWLNVLPVAPLGLKLDDTQMRIACGLRMGARLCQPHSCSGCGTEVSSMGTHGLSCKINAGRLVRHNHVNDLVRRACVSAGATAILEPPGICRSDGRRPDGITLVPWSQGRQLVWDFTCRDTLAPSLVAMSSTGPAKVAADGERAKSLKYADLDRNYNFQPLCVETLGAWGPSALKLVREIGARVQSNTCEPRSTSFLLQAISMAVQRGNVASVLGTLPHGKQLEEVFDL